MERSGVSENGHMHGPHESTEHFIARMAEKNRTPSWAEMREQQNHAEAAYQFLASAPFHGDATMAKVMVDAATVHATLALHDKVEELCQTMKHVIGKQTETNAELMHEIKRATNLREANLRRVA
jgi:hypothetical protein